MSLKKIVSTTAIFTSVLAAATVLSRPANASPISVTLEAPGVQESSLYLHPQQYGAVNAVEETFDSVLPLGYHASSFNTKIGTFDNGLIESADQYGGAGGIGHYFDVDTSRSGNSNYTTATLTLNSPQRYLGLWWSAGDATNVLEFYSHNQLVERLTTADVRQFVSSTPANSAYYANPTANFKGQDGNEPFAYLNFFANTGFSFDQVKFTNIGGSGFEADNFTVAADYGTTSGNKLVPESSTTVGLFLIAGLGLLSQRKRLSSNA